VDWSIRVQVHVDARVRMAKAVDLQAGVIAGGDDAQGGLSKTSLLGDGKPVYVQAYPARSGKPSHGYMCTSGSRMGGRYSSRKFQERNR
jgi:hypothetical protein